MLQRNDIETQIDDRFLDESSGFDFDFLIAAARRRWKIIAAGLIAGLVLGYAYLATAIPLYTATTRLLIDTPETRTAQEVSGVTEGIFVSGEVDSQVELIRSEAIAGQVVDSLDLVNDTSFWEQEHSPIDIVFDWLQYGSRFVALQVQRFLADDTGSVEQGSAGTDTAIDELSSNDAVELLRRKGAINGVRGGLSVGRVGRTYVLAIGFTSTNPSLAARIANGYATAYINDQLESKYSATRRASEWLLTRTEELRVQAANAEQAVEAFRQANGLVVSSGTLISDQQLAEINGQLIAARAEVSQIKARYDRLNDIIQSGDAGAAVSETLNQGITSNLRQRYLEASKRLAEITGLLGPNHAQAVRLRNEMFQLQRLMFEELKRVTEVTGNDLEVARIRVRELQDDLDALVGTSNEVNETQIQLRELERSATSLRGLYTTFLERYQESLQTQSFPISDARIITPAERPGFASYPRRSRSLIMALLLGGMVGGGLAALLELRDRVFRTGDQVREELGIEFIGMLPAISPSSSPVSKLNVPKPAHLPRTNAGESSYESPLGALDLAGFASARKITQRDPVMQYALANSMSGFSETLRSAKVAADIAIDVEGAPLVGIASVLPGEGKTTISKNLASLVASQGSRVLLIDGDIRNPGLTRATAKDSEGGLVEVIVEGESWRSLLRYEDESGLYILPTILKRRVSHTSDLLMSPGMRKLVNDARPLFDYIFIDMPPMGPVVDVRAMLPLLDGLLFVVEWGKTNRKIVKNTILEDGRVQDKALGVILNKVDKDKLKMYDSYQSKSYYSNRYSKYYSH